MAVLETGTGAGFFMKALFTGVFGLAGAAIIASVDPPKTKKMLFLQAAVAITISLLFGPIVLSALDYYFEFISLSKASLESYLEIAAPVHALIGALSWGGVGFLVKLRELLASDGARILKEKVENK